jgi:hypothetical protein
MFLRNLFFRNKPWMFKPEINDDIFGRMWFNTNKKHPEYNHYQGHFLFGPVKKEIDIFIDSDKDGFSNQQKSLFKKVEKDYHNFISRITQPMQEKLSKRKSREIVINDFNKEFQLSSISIARVVGNNEEITLYFSSEAHAVPGIRVLFRNSEVIEID